MKELFLSYMQKYPTWIRLFGLLKKNMMEEYRKMLSLVLKNIQKIKNYIFFYYLCKCIGNNLQALGDIRFLVVNCFHLMILTYWKQLILHNRFTNNQLRNNLELKNDVSK